mgnify:CR=1 FL=1
MQMREYTAVGCSDDPEYRELELLALKAANLGVDPITDPFAFAVLFPAFEKAPFNP